MIFAALAAAFALTLTSVHVVDGDTIKSDGETYRVLGIDTPEIHHAQCPAEKALGLAAKERVEALINGAKEVRVTRPKREWPRDKYGRRLARVLLDGRDLGDILVEEGLAVAWGGKAPKPGWC